jgi:isopenicillin-N N-acyltransferase-like protein
MARALRFLPFFEAFAPEQVAEIRGIAAGAEIPFGLALLANVRAEVGVFDRRPSVASGCTAFAAGRAATADGGVILGQNQDQSRLLQDLVVVLRIEPERGPRILTATFGGLLGYGGINSAGVGLMQNALATTTWRLGLPHYPLKRALLEQETLAGCLGVLGRAPLASCANYVLVDRDQVLDVETTPDGYALVGEGAPWVAHTNHFRTTTLAAVDRLLASLPDSAPRCRRIETLLGARHGQITLADARCWLSDHDGFPTSICRHPTTDQPTAMMSLYAVIGEPDKGLLHLSAGPPCTAPFSTYRLT